MIKISKIVDNKKSERIIPLDENGEPLDGVIKYNCQWNESVPLNYNRYLKELNFYRQKLYEINLIGRYPQSIGFGNISYRNNCNNQQNENQKSFIITGSATGEIEKLDENHYCTVDQFDLMKNNLICTGPIKASSESMTHGTIYSINSEIKAVIHVHNYEMWKFLLHKIPTTRKEAKYGTPEIALEVQRLFKETNVQEKQIFVLEGHKDGIFSFGKSLTEAYEIIYKYYQSIIENNKQSLDLEENTFNQNFVEIDDEKNTQKQQINTYQLKTKKITKENNKKTIKCNDEKLKISDLRSGSKYKSKSNSRHKKKQKQQQQQQKNQQKK